MLGTDSPMRQVLLADPPPLRRLLRRLLTGDVVQRLVQLLKQFGSTGVEDVGWIGWNGGGTRRLVSLPQPLLRGSFGGGRTTGCSRAPLDEREGHRSWEVLAGRLYNTNRIFEIDDAVRFLPRSSQPGRRLKWSVGILYRTFPVGQVL